MFCLEYCIQEDLSVYCINTENDSAPPQFLFKIFVTVGGLMPGVVAVKTKRT